MLYTKYKYLIKSFDDLKLKKYYYSYRSHLTWIKDISVRVNGNKNNEVYIQINTPKFILKNFSTTKNVGYVLQFLIDFFGLTSNGSADITELKNTPFRIFTQVCNDVDIPIAIGHTTKDKCVYLADLYRLNIDDEEEEQF